MFFRLEVRPNFPFKRRIGDVRERSCTSVSLTIRSTKKTRSNKKQKTKNLQTEVIYAVGERCLFGGLRAPGPQKEKNKMGETYIKKKPKEVPKQSETGSGGHQRKNRMKRCLRDRLLVLSLFSDSEL